MLFRFPLRGDFIEHLLMYFTDSQFNMILQCCKTNCKKYKVDITGLCIKLFQQKDNTKTRVSSRCKHRSYSPNALAFMYTSTFVISLLFEFRGQIKELQTQSSFIHSWRTRWCEQYIHKLFNALMICICTASCSELYAFVLDR